MTKAVLEYVSEKSRALMAAPSCCPEAKAAATRHTLSADEDGVAAFIESIL